jgi:hypothetical protein
MFGTGTSVGKRQVFKAGTSVGKRQMFRKGSVRLRQTDV